MMAPYRYRGAARQAARVRSSCWRSTGVVLACGARSDSSCTVHASCVMRERCEQEKKRKRKHRFSVQNLCVHCTNAASWFTCINDSASTLHHMSGFSTALNHIRELNLLLTIVAKREPHVLRRYINCRCQTHRYFASFVHPIVCDMNRLTVYVMTREENT